MAAKYRREKSEKTCPNYFSTLPRDTSILRCKAVCKEWLDVVTTDPVLAIRHYDNNFMALVGKNVIVDCYETKKSENEKRSCFYISEPYRFDDTVALGGSWNGCDDVANSCKGFLLMVNWDMCDPEEVVWTFVVYNPLTNETVFIPKLLMSEKFSNDVLYGLGFSLVSKRFKVVLFIHDNVQNTYSLQIFVLGDSTTGAWRTVSLPDGSWYLFGCMDNPIDLNGFLHYKTIRGRIECLDVEKEELCQMSIPFIEENSSKCLSSIGVYKGLLCLGINLHEYQYPRETEISVMKEYGVNESWMQVVVIKEILAYNSIHNHPKRKLGFLRPKLADILDTGETIFMLSDQHNSYDVFSYDLINECFEKLPFSKDCSRTHMTNIKDFYTPSFFYLKYF